MFLLRGYVVYMEIKILAFKWPTRKVIKMACSRSSIGNVLYVGAPQYTSEESNAQAGGGVYKCELNEKTVHCPSPLTFSKFKFTAGQNKKEALISFHKLLLV